MKITNKQKKIFLMTAAIIIVAVILLISFCQDNVKKLVLTNADTGEEYGTFCLPESDEFAVTFVHSVNKSPVTDVYIAKGKDIYLDRTIYYDFGAGVPTTLQEGQKLEFGDNGEMIISGYDMKIPDLLYIVGTVSDHTLTVGDEETSLRTLCGRNSKVRFAIS